MPKGKPLTGKRRIISATEYKGAINILARLTAEWAPDAFLEGYIELTPLLAGADPNAKHEYVQFQLVLDALRDARFLRKLELAADAANEKALG